MTDTQLFVIDEENDSQVAQWYKRLMNQTIQIDEKLDAGSEAATRRAFTGNLVDAQKSAWESGIESIKRQLTPVLEAENYEEFVGVYLGLVRGITAAFKKQADAWIDKQVENLPKPEESGISDEEKKALSTERSELAKQLKTIKTMAETFGEPGAAEWALPTQRRAFGKRGERALYTYTWTIDGQEMPEDDDNPKGVSEALGFAKVSEFTQALKDAGINTTKPDPEFTREIKGKQVTASKASDETDEEETVTPEGESE